ncbi:DinB family protein [Intrasporangium flavum]|uniref:DinB family protein n=1 Tax=Intrasporangium flavum TaxID=1428657 RepID=UPI00096FB830|nr:DinB family protein [Intrasporangium flavum]
MIDDFARTYLHDALRWVRESMLTKLDGLSEYDARRPLTSTGTNVLGLVRHLAMSEAVYLGAVLDRPLQGMPRYDDPGYTNRDRLWVPEDLSRADVLEEYERACRHADATIEALPVDAPGFVPWWPRPHVMLFNVLVHVLTETNRHAGHADLLREQLDGVTSHDAGPVSEEEDADRARHRGRVEHAARAAQERADARREDTHGGMS